MKGEEIKNENGVDEKMADIKAFLSGNFLNAEMVRAHGSDWTILTEATIEESGKYDREQLQMDVEGTNGQQFVYAANKGSAGRLAKLWGNDSKGWIGKRFRVSIVKVLVNGELKDSLQAEPIVAETQKVA